MPSRPDRRQRTRRRADRTHRTLSARFAERFRRILFESYYNHTTHF